MAKDMTQIPPNPNHDLAAFERIGDQVPFQLWVGEMQPITDSAPSLVAAAKQYEVMALTATGVTTFIVGTHTAQQVVVAAQAVTKIGQQVPYWEAGKFNHMALVWPVDVTLDTLPERKAFLMGSMVRVGHLN